MRWGHAAAAPVLVSGALALAGPALGAEIPVPNFSFDDPALADGVEDLAVNSDSTTVPGWISVWTGLGASGGGVHDPQNTQFLGSTGDDAPLPATADGGQAVFLRSSAIGDTESFTTVDPLVASVAEGETYTLTVAVGDPLDLDPGTVSIQILLNDSRVVETVVDDTDLLEGGFVDVTAALTISPTQAGRELKIRLRHTSPGVGQRRVYFDNVALADSTVPEPAHALLLLAGAAVLAAARSRRA